MKYTAIMYVVQNLGQILIKIKNYLKEREELQMIKQEPLLN